MSDMEFEQEVLQRLSRIEAKMESQDELQKEVKEVRDIAILAQDSAKSAHHRIDGMYAIAGAIGGIIAFFVSMLTR